MADTVRIVDVAGTPKVLLVGGAVNLWDGTGTPCCCGEDCLGCVAGTVPAQIQVTLGAWATQGHIWTPDCDDTECDFLEGDFVLDFVPRPDGVCEWQYNDNSVGDCLLDQSLVLRTQKVSPGNFLIRLTLSGLYFANRPFINGGPGTRIYFFKWEVLGLGEAPECDAFSDYALPYVSAGSGFQVAGGLEEGCIYGGSDALLTSL